MNFKEYLQTLNEEAPPDPDIEAWIKKNKQRFKDQYGEKKGTEILYATAWQMYKKKHGED